MRTVVYVDGFNLYYGAVKNTSRKWLDLGKLARFMLPGDQIAQIKYFTARVHPTPRDPRVDVRQQTYIRALRTIDNLSVHYGHFLTNTVKLPRSPLTSPPKLVEVLKTEEKGSDVNLASHLLVDCFDDACEQAIIVSADSDLAFPIQLARNRYGKRVGILLPFRHDSAKLRQVANFHRVIRMGAIAACQFPDSLADKRGWIHKPSGW